MNQTKFNRRKYIPWIFIPCILALVIQFLAGIMTIQGCVVLAIGSFKGESYLELVTHLANVMMNEMNDMLYLLYVIPGIVVFAILYKQLFGNGIKLSFKGISKNVVATVGGVVLFCLGMQYVSVYLLNSLSVAFPSWLEEYQEIIEMAGISNEMTVAMFIYTILLGPICEELIFRGITYKAATKVMPYYLAIIVQAVLFGAFHMNALQASYAIVIGLGLGYIMYLYDNIILTMFIHIIYNFLGTYGMTYLPIGGNTLISFFLWMLGALVVTYISILLLRKGSTVIKEDNILSDI
ncbi:MAG: CPBP family intramembrane metalloprotease [Pseudobutyrivibrio sp.]|nr:CPBP family intramembrane metalloprotease [Pseudobutyrivibrio sp.]